jgi:hypothetical protein
MDFTEQVEELSTKYRMEYPKTHDLMTYISFRIGLDKPKDFLFHRAKIYEKTYNLAERYLSIKNNK